MKVRAPDDPLLVEGFRSNQEKGRPPLPRERQIPVLHSGLSVWRLWEQAAGTARRYPQHGEFVARLILEGPLPVLFWPNGLPGHVTIWGDPVVLSATVADISPVLEDEL